VVTRLGERELYDADIELLVIAVQVAVMRHIQAKFEKLLIEHGEEAD
jgi:hypothetical protein